MNQRKTASASLLFQPLGLLLATILTFVAASRGAEPASSPASWATGPEFAARLNQTVGVYWAGKPFRQAVVGLGAMQGVAVLLDRRVDPDAPVHFTASARLGDVFRKVAAERGSGCCLFHDIVYIGPQSATEELRTVAELFRDRVRQLPAASARRLARRQPLQWSDLETPRRLLERLAGEASVELVGGDLVPHDLWAGASLPPLSLADHMTLVAFQYSLKLEADPRGRSVRLSALEADPAIVREYAGGLRPEETAQRWRQLVPGSRVSVSGSRVIVAGLLEAHEAIMAGARDDPPGLKKRPAAVAEPGLEDKRYSLSVADKRLGALLEALAEQLRVQSSIEIMVDRDALAEAGVSLEQPVSFAVRSASLDELLLAVLKGTGCSYRRDGYKVWVVPQ